MMRAAVVVRARAAVVVLLVLCSVVGAHARSQSHEARMAAMEAMEASSTSMAGSTTGTTDKNVQSVGDLALVRKELEVMVANTGKSLKRAQDELSALQLGVAEKKKKNDDKLVRIDADLDLARAKKGSLNVQLEAATDKAKRAQQAADDATKQLHTEEENLREESVKFNTTVDSHKKHIKRCSQVLAAIVEIKSRLENFHKPPAAKDTQALLEMMGGSSAKATALATALVQKASAAKATPEEQDLLLGEILQLLDELRVEVEQTRDETTKALADSRESWKLRKKELHERIEELVAETEQKQDALSTALQRKATATEEVMDNDEKVKALEKQRSETHDTIQQLLQDPEVLQATNLVNTHQEELDSIKQLASILFENIAKQNIGSFHTVYRFDERQADQANQANQADQADQPVLHVQPLTDDDLKHDVHRIEVDDP